MLGPKGMAFDNDEILDDNDDEDLKSDPISQMDMQVGVSFIRLSIFLKLYPAGSSAVVPAGMRCTQHQQFLDYR